MAKITKTQLQDQMDTVKYAAGNIMPCVNDTEKNRAKDYLRTVGLQLIEMLEDDLAKPALSLVAKAESMIDRNVKLLEL